MNTNRETLIGEYKAYKATFTRTPWTHLNAREEAGRLLTASNPMAEYRRHAYKPDEPGPYWLEVVKLILGAQRR